MPLKKWWFIRSFLKYSSPLLSMLEKPAIEKYGNRSADFPVVFIIGPPRTGSTIVYQLITSLLDVSYIDNLANLARNNPYTGMQLSRRFFGNRRHDNFSSDYGRTQMGGLHAPAEALFFYKWFPKDRHYTEMADLTPDQITRFQKTIRALVNRAGKPLVIKNLSFSLRLQVLREVLPEARYIVVRRDPLYTAQSVLIGKRKQFAGANRVWSILPKNYRMLENLPEHEMVVKQIHGIEQEIHRDLSSVPEKHVLFIEYESLRERLVHIMKEVSELTGTRPANQRIEQVKKPEPVNRISLPEKDLDALKDQIRLLNWELH